MKFESLLNQFKSENSFLGRRTYSDNSVELVKACGHVQNFHQIGKICSPAVKKWGALLL